MQKPKHHIFVCGSFRANGAPQGVCNKKSSMQLLQYLEQELADRGLSDVVVSSTGCLKVCDRGPAMVIYPGELVVWRGRERGHTRRDNRCPRRRPPCPRLPHQLSGLALTKGPWPGSGRTVPFRGARRCLARPPEETPGPSTVSTGLDNIRNLG